MYRTANPSAVYVVGGALLAIGGSKNTSAILTFHPVDQKWQHAILVFLCTHFTAVRKKAVGGGWEQPEGLGGSKCYGQF